MMFWAGFISGIAFTIVAIIAVLIAAIWDQRGPRWARPWGGL